MDPSKLQTLIVAIPGILIAICYHEYAHGWVANRLGDPTAKAAGRLTLNPLAHIDPFGTLLLPVILYFMGGFIFGYAKPVPVNFYNLRNPKRDMALVAAAGPVTNILLALACTFCLKLTTVFLGATGGAGYFFLEPLSKMFVFAILINVILAFFNMMPIPPLDGGRILVGVLPDKQAEAVSRIEPFGIFIVLGIILLNPLGLYTHTLGAAIRGTFNLLLGIAG